MRTESLKTRPAAFLARALPHSRIASTRPQEVVRMAGLKTLALGLSSCKLCLRLVMLIVAVAAYFVMKGSDDIGIALREGEDVNFNSTCFIFRQERNSTFAWDVDLEVEAEFGIPNSTFANSSVLEENCGFRGSPSWGAQGSMEHLLEETDVGGYLVYAVAAVALTLVVDGCLLGAKAGGIIESIVAGAKEASEGDAEGCIGACANCFQCCLGRISLMIFSGTIKVFTLVIPYVMFKPFSNIKYEDDYMWMRFPAGYAYLSVSLLPGVPFVGVAFACALFCGLGRGGACGVLCGGIFGLAGLLATMMLFILAFFTFLQDGFVFFINFRVIFSFSFGISFAIYVDMLQLILGITALMDMLSGVMNVVALLKTCCGGEDDDSRV